VKKGANHYKIITLYYEINHVWLTWQYLTLAMGMIITFASVKVAWRRRKNAMTHATYVRTMTIVQFSMDQNSQGVIILLRILEIASMMNLSPCVEAFQKKQKSNAKEKLDIFGGMVNQFFQFVKQGNTMESIDIVSYLDQLCNSEQVKSVIKS